MRWLSNMFNRTGWFCQAATRWDLPPYRIAISLINGAILFLDLFTWWFDTRFLSNRLSPQANRLNKCLRIFFQMLIFVNNILLHFMGTYFSTCYFSIGLFCEFHSSKNCFTTWKVSKYVVFSGPYFPKFSPNTGKYGPEKTPYLGTFQTVVSWIRSF